MHVSSKEVDKDGRHIVTNLLEADGASELASDKASFSASVVSVRRTSSGGIEIQTAVQVLEPQPVAELQPQDKALEFLKSKGHSDDESKAMIERFGLERVNAEMAAEEQRKREELDQELKAVLSPKQSE